MENLVENVIAQLEHHQMNAKKKIMEKKGKKHHVVLSFKIYVH